MNSIQGVFTPDTQSTENYREYLQRVMTIQSEAVRRLADGEALAPLEMASMLEDVANRFQDISEELRGFALGRPSNLHFAE